MKDMSAQWSKLQKELIAIDQDSNASLFDENETYNKDDVFSTGINSFDKITGRPNGLVRGKLYQFWGESACTKSTAVMYALASAQKKFPDKMVALFDVEGTIDRDYYRSILNIDNTRFAYLDQTNLESIFLSIKRMCESGLFSVIAIDSVAEMVTNQEDKNLESGGSEQPGRLAAGLSKYVKTIKKAARQNKVCIIFVNQCRVDPNQAGDQRKPMGGKTIFFAVVGDYMFTRSNSKALIDDGLGKNEITVTCKKNKLGGGHGQTAKYDIKLDGTGIDTISMEIDQGVEIGILEKKGAWYKLSGQEENLAQGKAKLTELFKNDQLLYSKFLESLDTGELIDYKKEDIYQVEVDATPI